MFLVLLLASCRHTKTFVSESSNVEYTYESNDTIIPGFSLTAKVPFTQIDTVSLSETIVIYDSLGLGEIRIWKDKYGNLLAECSEKDQLIEKIREKEINTNSTVSNKEVIKYRIPKWIWYVLGAVALYIVFKVSRFGIDKYLGRF